MISKWDGNEIRHKKHRDMKQVWTWFQNENPRWRRQNSSCRFRQTWNYRKYGVINVNRKTTKMEDDCRSEVNPKWMKHKGRREAFPGSVFDGPTQCRRMLWNCGCGCLRFFRRAREDMNPRLNPKWMKHKGTHDFIGMEDGYKIRRPTKCNRKLWIADADASGSSAESQKTWRAHATNCCQASDEFAYTDQNVSWSK